MVIPSAIPVVLSTAARQVHRGMETGPRHGLKAVPYRCGCAVVHRDRITWIAKS
jgi:hypothetical protein